MVMGHLSSPLKNQTDILQNWWVYDDVLRGCTPLHENVSCSFFVNLSPPPSFSFYLPRKKSCTQLHCFYNYLQRCLLTEFDTEDVLFHATLILDWINILFTTILKLQYPDTAWTVWNFAVVLPDQECPSLVNFIPFTDWLVYCKGHHRVSANRLKNCVHKQ